MSAQLVVVGMVVLAATVYVARTLGPRRWRRKAAGTTGTAAAGQGGDGECGCKDGKSCH